MSYDHRRASASIRVFDANGNALAHRKLCFEQREHDFWFGCGAFDTVPYANGKADEPFFRDRVEKWLALFNFASEEKTAWIRDPEPYTDLLTGETCAAGAVRVPAGGFRWLLHVFEE